MDYDNKWNDHYIDWLEMNNYIHKYELYVHWMNNYCHNCGKRLIYPNNKCNCSKNIKYMIINN